MLTLLGINTTMELMVMLITYFTLATFIITLNLILYKDMKKLPTPINYMIVLTICVMCYTIIETLSYLQFFIIYYVPLLYLLFKLTTHTLVDTTKELEIKSYRTLKTVFYTLSLGALMLDTTKIYLVEKFLKG